MIKLKVNYIDAEDIIKLTKLLSEGFKVVKVSKPYETSRDKQKRVYVNIEG